MKKIIILILMFFPLTALAACPPGTPPGTVCLDNPLAGNPTSASTIIGTIIKGALTVLGSLTLLMLIWGGFQWLTSAGNEEKVKQGSETMIWALIGVVVIFTAYILISTLTNILSGQ